MITDLHDLYVCISPVFRGGRLYKLGDPLLVPKGEVLKSKNFMLEKAAEGVEKPPTPKPKPKKKGKVTSEVEV